MRCSAQSAADGTEPLIEALPEDHRERAMILQFSATSMDFTQWSELMAAREIRKNCVAANRDMLRVKQQEITMRLPKPGATKNVEKRNYKHSMSMCSN